MGLSSFEFGCFHFQFQGYWDKKCEAELSAWQTQAVHSLLSPVALWGLIAEHEHTNYFLYFRNKVCLQMNWHRRGLNYWTDTSKSCLPLTDNRPVRKATLSAVLCQTGNSSLLRPNLLLKRNITRWILPVCFAHFLCISNNLLVLFWQPSLCRLMFLEVLTRSKCFWK